MKLRILFLATIIFSAFCRMANGQAEITGSIYITNGKDILKKSLASPFTEQNVTNFGTTVYAKKYFAVSEDGSEAVVLCDGKIWNISLPSKKTVSVKVQSKIIPKVKDYPIYDEFAKEANALAISPDGKTVAYDLSGIDDAWVLAQLQPANGLPMYEKRTMSCRAVNVLSVKYVNRMEPCFFDQSWPFKVGMTKNAMFGNVAYYAPSKLPYQFLMPDGRLGKTDQYGMAGLRYFGNLHPTCQQAIEKFTQQRDVFAFAFGRLAKWKGHQFFIVIYKTQNGIGPIELVDLDKDKLAETKKPGIYTIHMPVPLRSCYSFGLTPEGSIVIHSEGKIGIIDSESIYTLINGSSVGIDTNSDYVVNSQISRVVKQWNYKHEVAVNNSMVAKIRIVADGIVGTNVCFVREDSFLYLRDDRSVCFAKTGEAPKPLFQINSPLFYYSPGANNESMSQVASTSSANQEAPVQTTTTDASSSGEYRKIIFSHPIANVSTKRKSSVWRANYTIRTADGKVTSETSAFFDLGLQWKQNPKNKNGVILCADWDKYDHKDNSIVYTIAPDGTDLANIHDPGGLSYMKGELPISLPVNFGAVMIFRYGHMYVAVKPVKINHADLKADIANIWFSSPKTEEDFKRTRVALLMEKTQDRLSSR